MTSSRSRVLSRRVSTVRSSAIAAAYLAVRAGSAAIHASSATSRAFAVVTTPERVNPTKAPLLLKSPLDTELRDTFNSGSAVASSFTISAYNRNSHS